MKNYLFCGSTGIILNLKFTFVFILNIYLFSIFLHNIFKNKSYFLNKLRSYKLMLIELGLNFININILLIFGFTDNINNYIYFDVKYFICISNTIMKTSQVINYLRFGRVVIIWLLCNKVKRFEIISEFIFIGIYIIIFIIFFIIYFNLHNVSYFDDLNKYIKKSKVISFNSSYFIFYILDFLLLIPSRKFTKLFKIYNELKYIFILHFILNNMKLIDLFYPFYYKCYYLQINFIITILAIIIYSIILYIYNNKRINLEFPISQIHVIEDFNLAIFEYKFNKYFLIFLKNNYYDIYLEYNNLLLDYINDNIGKNYKDKIDHLIRYYYEYKNTLSFEWWKSHIKKNQKFYKIKYSL